MKKKLLAKLAFCRTVLLYLLLVMLASIGLGVGVPIPKKKKSLVVIEIQKDKRIVDEEFEEIDLSA